MSSRQPSSSPRSFTARRPGETSASHAEHNVLPTFLRACGVHPHQHSLHSIDPPIAPPRLRLRILSLSAIWLRRCAPSRFTSSLSSCSTTSSRLPPAPLTLRPPRSCAGTTESRRTKPPDLHEDRRANARPNSASGVQRPPVYRGPTASLPATGCGRPVASGHRDDGFLDDVEPGTPAGPARGGISGPRLSGVSKNARRRCSACLFCVHLR